MRIGVAGITGRVGQLVANEITAAGAALSGGIARHREHEARGPLCTSIADLAAASDVVVDFTQSGTVRDHAAALMTTRTGWVLGSTGLSAEDQAEVEAAARFIAIVQAANFSPGMNLILALAEQLGAALRADTYDAEIWEMHHRQKEDAPSGTALALGAAVARGRGVGFDTMHTRCRDGHSGPRATGAIGFAALRGGQVVGEHTLLFAADDEQIALTHRAFDRRSFARGAVRAALWLEGRAPGLYGMRHILGMEPTP